MFPLPIFLFVFFTLGFPGLKSADLKLEVFSPQPTVAKTPDIHHDVWLLNESSFIHTF